MRLNKYLWPLNKAYQTGTYVAELWWNCLVILNFWLKSNYHMENAWHEARWNWLYALLFLVKNPIPLPISCKPTHSNNVSMCCWGSPIELWPTTFTCGLIWKMENFIYLPKRLQVFWSCKTLQEHGLWAPARGGG